MLVINLFDKLKSWFGLCEISKVCNIPILDTYTKGQQIRVYSQVYKSCTKLEYIVDEKSWIPGKNDYYQGAIVFDPIPGVYNKVVPFDFASLYPTTIIAYNICWSTLVIDNTIPDYLCHIIEWEDHVGCPHSKKIKDKISINSEISKLREKIKKIKKIKKYKNLEKEVEKLKNKIEDLLEKRILVNVKPKRILCCKRKFRFLRSPLGILPTILKDLLEARRKTREQIKKLKHIDSKSSDKNSLLINVLNKRQLSYKTAANSAYGAMGVHKGYLPFMPGAMCTTAYGRKNIIKVKKMIEENFKGTVIYGDTDSCLAIFPHLNTSSEIWDYSEEVADKITTYFLKPMKLEFEQTIYWKFLILTKKRYMNTISDRNGNITKNKDKTIKIGKKGVLLARRDSSKFVKKIYEKVVKMIFDNKKMNEILYTIIDEINKLFSHSISYEDFIITKSIGEDFISDADIILREHESKPHLLSKNNPNCIKCQGKCGDYKVKLLPETNPLERQRLLNLKKCDINFDKRQSFDEVDETYVLTSL